MKTILKYGISLGIVLIVFKIIEYYYFSHKIELDTYLGIVAFIFLGLGLYFGRKFFQKSLYKTPPPISGTPLSAREQEILHLISQGNTNQQISDKLFISLNTTKTHIKNVFFKLEAKNCTEALFKAKLLKIIE